MSPEKPDVWDIISWKSVYAGAPSIVIELIMR